MLILCCSSMWLWNSDTEKYRCRRCWFWFLNCSKA